MNHKEQQAAFNAPLGQPRHGRAPIDKVRAKNSKQTLRRLWRYMSTQKWGLSAVLLCVVLNCLFNLAGPYLIGQAIDNYMQTPHVIGLAHTAVALLLVFILVSITTWLQHILMAPVAQHTVMALRETLFAKLQLQPIRFFDTHPHGDLMSRLSNDVDTISNVLNESIVQFMSAAITLVGVGFMMFSLNLWMAMISLITIPILAQVIKVVAKHTRKGFQDQQKQVGALNALIEETISGAKIIKAYGQEERIIRDFDDANMKLKTASTRAQTMMMIPGPLGNFLNNLTFAIIACAGGVFVINGAASVGNIAAFIGYSRQFSRPVNQIANLYNTVQSAIAGAERVFELIDLVPEQSDNEHAMTLSTINGEVVFDHVCFSYQPNQPVLRHISLHAKPGETIAFVGPTGAGKTTIVNLLTRFYDVDSGAIFVDGYDINTLQRDSLRSHLGIVLQDTYLFSESVMDNIRYGCLYATQDQVIEAAKLADAHSFIMHLPDGYQTQLSERGANLSQGQRQLIAIARAILADPAILILDEATSSVDTRTEIKIQQALLRLMKGRTSFVIAHRLSTIREADQVLVIDDGQILESGNHAQLLQAKGRYYDLFMSQFKGTHPDSKAS